MSAIDFRTLPASVPSLCIPRVYVNIDENRIRRIFNDLNLGVIDRIDIVRKTTDKGEQCNRVFIHFDRWYSGRNADAARERLINGQDIKVIYDDPWFWKVSAYKSTTACGKEAPVRIDYARDDRYVERRDERYNDRRNDRYVDNRGYREQYDPRIYDRKDRPHETKRDRIVSALKEHNHNRKEQRRERPSKQDLDRELERINPTIPQNMRVEEPVKPVAEPAVVASPVAAPEPAPTNEVFVHSGTVTKNGDAGTGVIYDEAAISAAKKRKITIKK